MSRRPRATGNHAIAACPRGRPRTLDGRRLRERTATSFPGSCRSNPSRFGAGRDRIHRRKRGWGGPSASKTAASKAKIASPRFPHRWAEQGAFLVTCNLFGLKSSAALPGSGWPFRPRSRASLLRSCQCRLKCRSHGSELDEEVARQVLWFDLAALFPPKAQESALVLAHDDPGVRSTDEGTAVNCPLILHIAASSSIENS